jgi:Rps23 Pro-64 3,4-dihydroxylase Tpa1-like proline 4-hydroxylase
VIPERYRVIRANECIRYSKYLPGERFMIHKDGINQDRFGNRSVITVNIFLNDNFSGGETRFYQSGEQPLRETVVPKVGRAAIFDSQQYHEGCEVNSGTKYLLRTDLMTPL